MENAEGMRMENTEAAAPKKKDPEYHIQCNPETGLINCGKVNKKGDKWASYTEVTEEALVAVRDHLLFVAAEQKFDNIGYQWTLANGNTIVLEVKVQAKEDGKE